MSFTDVLFKPNGRISQGQFWAGWGVILAGNIVANFIPLLGLIISLGLIYVGCCVYGKRLHDMGKSAWLHAIPWGISIVLTIVAVVIAMPAIMAAMQNADTMSEEEMVAAMMGSMGPAMGIGSLSMLIWLGYTIWVGVSGSDPNDNQYGPGLAGSDDTFV